MHRVSRSYTRNICWQNRYANLVPLELLYHLVKHKFCNAVLLVYVCGIHFQPKNILNTLCIILYNMDTVEEQLKEIARINTKIDRLRSDLRDWRARLDKL